jgi:hypothetical protein
MDENLLKQLFQWPADRPLRKPRFGTNAPPEPKALPPAGADQFLDKASYREPFSLEHALDNLGLIVSAEEGLGERAGELWVTVRSTVLTHRGKEVRVRLIGGEERFKRVSVTIDQQDPNGCFGEARVGRIDEVRAELGDDKITLNAFLLD